MSSVPNMTTIGYTAVENDKNYICVCRDNVEILDKM
nr:MAG TPA: hypothetical protein [Caudoviricetes sp.]DAN66246.1 MAG TPA: hypothetical protein [Caudoviricetes sp.]